MHRVNNIRNKEPVLERRFAVLALLLIILAWTIGSFRAQEKIMPHLKSLCPSPSGPIESIAPNLYCVWNDENKSQTRSYLAVISSRGYGGPMTVITKTDLQGQIIDVLITNHKETPSFFRRISKRNFTSSLKEKSYRDPLVLNIDVDGLSGATYTCKAIVKAVRSGSRLIAQQALKLPVPKDPKLKIFFGFPEIILLFLFGLGYLGTKKCVPIKKTIRWITLLGSLFFIGFIFNNPLNLVVINKILLGFWPPWQHYLYWYLLLAIILISLTFNKKNLYCERICPFGAAQECLNAIGGGNAKPTYKLHKFLRWSQRILALAAIIMALMLKNPGLSSFEIFSTFFRLLGANWQFVLLGLILILSLLVKRPWCSYLCPIRAIIDYIMLINNWLRSKLIRKFKIN